MSRTLTGRCLCGGVKYRIDPPFEDPIACHCRECQRHSGSFWVAISALRSGVEIIGDSLHWVAVSPSAWRGFCRDCGGYLFWQPVSGETLDVAYGTLDDAEDLKLSAHLFVSEARLPVPDDGVPRFEASRPSKNTASDDAAE